MMGTMNPSITKILLSTASARTCPADVHARHALGTKNRRWLNPSVLTLDSFPNSPFASLSHRECSAYKRIVQGQHMPWQECSVAPASAL